MHVHVDGWCLLFECHHFLLAEMILMSPLFKGKSEINQLSLIYKILGSPTETELPGSKFISMGRSDGLKQYFSCMLDKCIPGRELSDAGLELMQSCLSYDPSKRITCEDAMSSENSWHTERPRP